MWESLAESSLHGLKMHCVLSNVLSVLRVEKLYANLKKCAFCMEKIVFLGYVVTAQGIEMDEEKVKTIRDWLTPKSV